MDEKINLLLIDDEEAVCIGVRDALKREAFNIDYRLSAEEGLEYLENHKIDIVLQDIKLGRGMNGIDSLKKIKNKYKDIEVIMLTGEDKLTTGVECMKNGAFDYMTKPFNKEHFLEKANDAAAKKKYNVITEKNKGAMLQAMANGVCHQFNNRLNEFVFEQSDIAMMLDELMVGRSGGAGGVIVDKLGVHTLLIGYNHRFG